MCTEGTRMESTTWSSHSPAGGDARSREQPDRQQSPGRNRGRSWCNADTYTNAGRARNQNDEGLLPGTCGGN